MLPILLINPNTSEATTRMMVAIAQRSAGSAVQIRGETAAYGPEMITTVEALDAAEDAVINIGMREAKACAGVIVAAFGDPGAATLKRKLAVPVTGICESSMLESATHDGRFAVATTTPALVARIDESATRLGLAHRYAGTWLTEGDPTQLVSDARKLESALEGAVAACIREAGVTAVIIGGGPLSHVAASLSMRFAVPIIAPVAAAVRFLIGAIG